MCNNEGLFSILWDDKKHTKSLKQQLRNLIYDLNNALKKALEIYTVNGGEL